MSKKKLKDFTGYIVCSTSECCKLLNNEVVEKTICKAFPEDDNSTLYTVKLRGLRSPVSLYEDEMVKVRNMVKSIEEIKQAWNDGEYRCDIEVPAKVKEGYVFDEELSVRRNRELVFEHNEKAESMRLEKSAKQVELNKKFKNDVVDYIADTYSMSKEKAAKIESFVNINWHACMYDYFIYIDDVAQFVEELLEME